MLELLINISLSNFMAALDQMLIKCTSTIDNYYVSAISIREGDVI